MSGETGITREELLALPEAHGYDDFTEHKLTRWRHEGLIQRPEQRSLGRGHGTETIYPPDTREQLLALCAIHANERRLDYVAWHLWWAGYDVSSEPVRRFIASVVAEWDKQAQKLIDPKTGELSESGWDLVDEAISKRLTKPLSWMRKGVGKQWFDTFVRVVLEALLGSFEGFPDEPKKGNLQDNERYIVRKGLRLEQADDGPWPRIDIEACLKDIGWLASNGSLQQELDNLTY